MIEQGQHIHQSEYIANCGKKDIAIRKIIMSGT